MDVLAAAELVPSPSYLVDLSLLERNCQLLGSVRNRTGAKVLLALKGFAAFGTFPIVRTYLDGTCASSVHESMLGREEFGKEVHAYAPAFSRREMEALIPLVDHITFNSLRQWQEFKDLSEGDDHQIEMGLRINPEYSEVDVEIYNPCAAGSRLGIRSETLVGQTLDGISGLHFHTLCEQNADTLERTVEAVEERFAWLLRSDEIRWLNLGGGHHITRSDYDIGRLCRVVERISSRYRLQVYLEPGEAVALNSGYLVGTVLDKVQNEIEVAILDVSATAHMPDVLEMPYRPEILGAGKPGEKAYTYRLGGPTCLAGDVIGDYSFASPLDVDDRLIFTDMAHYTMVKNTTFNGVPLPCIATFASDSEAAPDVIRSFDYNDYRDRLS